MFDKILKKILDQLKISKGQNKYIEKRGRKTKNDICTDTVNPSKYLNFILKDCVTNTENSSKEEIDDLLLEKEKF